MLWVYTDSLVMFLVEIIVWRVVCLISVYGLFYLGFWVIFLRHRFVRV